jgi:hypothetical protein
VPQNSLGHGGVEDHADHPHLAAAAAAHQNVLAKDPLEQLDPRQPTVALGSVGASEVVGVVLVLRIDSS